MDSLNKDILETMNEMWGNVFCSRSLLYETIFIKFRRKGIAFGWAPRTKHVFIGYEKSGERQREFVMTSTHDELGWAVAELSEIAGNNFYWNGFITTGCPT